MAEVVHLKTVIEKLVTMSNAEAELLGFVKGKVKKLVGDLEAVKAFLCDANVRCFHHTRCAAHQGFNAWVKRVREVSYETDDSIEEFMVRISSTIHCYSHLLLLKARHRLDSRIKQILSTISSILLVIPRGCSTCLQGAMFTDPCSTLFWIDVGGTVGIDVPKEKLINLILDEDSRLTATFVTGMGGLGKTTLVRKTFVSNLVTRNFKHHAWVTVSKSFSKCGLLRATFKGFKDAAKEPVEPNNLQMMSNVALVEAIRSHLRGERFIIVLDDVWSVNAWEVLKYALSDFNCGSRILITTRNDDIATYFDIPVHVHQLHPLRDKEAWTLFCMKAFEGGEHKGVCPKELEAMSLKILNKCEGLPLAIIALGGMLLRKNKTLLEWNIVYDNLVAKLRSDVNLYGLEKTLLLSYDDLPYYLKSCYLYLSVFPKDFLIKRSKIVRLWVAERFVEEKVGLTLDEVAESYLNEFVSRNMIQLVEMDDLNRVKSFRVHDIVREIILLKSKEEAIVDVLDKKQQLTSNLKGRRISIHDNFEGVLEIHKTLPHNWSLLLFTTLPADSLFNRKSLRGFKLLRVIDLDRARILELPDHIFDLIHLTYLSLRKTMISSLPESIRKLKNLEILDLKDTVISFLPYGTLQLKKLRQVCNYRFRFGNTMFPDWRGMMIPAGIGGLTKLEKLGNIQVNCSQDRAIINEIGKLEQLRRLGLIGLQGDGCDVCRSLERLNNLKALYISSQSRECIVDLSSLLSPPQILQKVFLRCGLITLPNWISSLNYLSKLVLQYSNLEQDPLAALQDLPSMMVLELREAYNGEELCCAGTGYPKLKHLRLHNLPNLEIIELLNGAMPQLREMGLEKCEKLIMVPLGIENLNKLEYLHIQNMPLEFNGRLERDVGEDFLKVQHVKKMSIS
ncbi:unnamed protein product [Rhodiola kirilowii]